jgi:hypothetical protein
MIERHRPVNIKVNAPVDEGIAPLVLALNSIEGVMTIDSCQGYDGKAYVYFVVRGSSEDIALFAHRLAQALHVELTERWFWCLVLEWASDQPMMKIVCDNSRIEKMSGVVEGLASLFPQNSVRPS